MELVVKIGKPEVCHNSHDTLTLESFNVLCFFVLELSRQSKRKRRERNGLATLVPLASLVLFFLLRFIIEQTHELFTTKHQPPT